MRNGRSGRPRRAPGTKRRRKRRKGRREDLAFTDPGGNVHILTVGGGAGTGQVGGGPEPT